MNSKLKYGLLLGFPSLAYFVYRNYPKLNILTGFAAKNVCSCTFEAGRDLRSIEAGDNNFLPVFYAKNEIDFESKSVSSTIFGLKKRTAVYREGIGSVLLPENETETLPELPVPAREILPADVPYPFGKRQPENANFRTINQEALQRAVGNAFDPEEKDLQKTRAVLVLHKNKLLAEKYASGFSSTTKFLGWSMTKSITSAILGILEKKDEISISQDHLFKEWEGDERSRITLNNLLQMNSGLEWEEDYTRISDVTKMLFMEGDMSRIQIDKPLKGKPNHSWNYSSGTTNLLSRFIRNQFETHQEYMNFWYTELIDKIGMHSMIIEPDLDGNYIGSSYGWATARDWAKFGLLYLNNGKWNGEQILNESWVKYSAQPTNGSNGEYGAHFWLNAESKFPDVPKDMFSCNGFQGQYIFIIPSKDLVVVRFGLTETPDFDANSFLKGIIDAL
ncbi:serine hydrolase [Salegentibacter sp. F188]|uniref:Serine hydrolase n=1 Tax=Autumnicola patrickiae TaxID=3075591 RepID=A0ABU3E0R6_9FLAO|nr:serine hydrolase [Salegentibacter sp. F188]MDT0689574.1 serine hydrolase [Salegentibacter sp. F188]